MAYYHIWTVGCQMNKGDSASLAEDLERLGYQFTPAIEEADVIVVNSCVVRQSAEDRVLSKLGTLKALKGSRPQSLMALAGCMIDSNIVELGQRFPHIDLFLKPGAFSRLIDKAKEQAARPETPAATAETTPTAFVTVIEGCNNFCSYCIVPFRRGRERSRSIASIRCQVERLVGRGVKEVTLLGQNVDSYGHDLPERPDLADLLKEINSIDGLSRIRFLTSHPRDMSQKLIEAVATLDKVCPHINLPVQAGDDGVLRAMGRGYTMQDYRDLVQRIRANIPGVALSTDVIVGFPGETGEQFQHTYDLLSELRFDTVHVAAYSPRPGTLASKKLADDVPLSQKKQRLQKVEQLQERIATEINAGLVGQKMEVLVERKKSGKWEGRTRTGKLVFFSSPGELAGHIVNVHIEKASPWSLQGRRMDS